LLFRHHALDIVRFALDAVSETPIRLNGHPLNDGINPQGIDCGAPLRALWLVANVFIQLVSIGHELTVKICVGANVDGSAA
jgi:hypothetical protein